MAIPFPIAGKGTWRYYTTTKFCCGEIHVRSHPDEDARYAEVKQTRFCCSEILVRVHPDEDARYAEVKQTRFCCGEILVRVHPDEDARYEIGRAHV